MSRSGFLETARLDRRRFIVLSSAAALAGFVGRTGIATATTPAAVNATSAVFLDAGRVHSIDVTFDQSAYEAMIATYASSGDKEWLSARVTIDGSTYSEVGLRLKGNSSLMGLRSNGGGGQGAGNGDVVRAGGPGGEISADEPWGLPWLVRLDKYVDDQAHEGLKDLVIRSNNSQTSLNESVALDLLAASGLASQRSAPVAFTVNGSDAKLRLAVEHPNDEWLAQRFPAGGLLFKAESTGDFSYRGEDPLSYDDVFDLEAGGSDDDAADFAPLTAFLQFINESDDATFATEIESRLDTGQFAIYLAMMDLIDNFDDLDGPGNNGYLYIDPASSQVTVVPWDMNLAFGGLGGERIALPAEIAPPVEGQMPVRDDETMPQPPAGRAGAATPGGPMERSNPLVQRFRAVPSFATQIEEESSRLRASLYANGAAREMLTTAVQVLEDGATTMVEPATINAESQAIASYFAATA